MTDDEKDRALCEAHCNSAADEYFNARPQLDSGVNRRIFYAGHRKAWIERGEAVRLNAQGVPDGWVLVPVEATLDMLDAFRNHDDSVLGPDFLGAYRAMLSAAPAAPQPALAPRKIKTPPPGADALDVAFAEDWNQCCDAYFGGLPPQAPLVVTVFKTNSDTAAPQPAQREAVRLNAQAVPDVAEIQRVLECVKTSVQTGIPVTDGWRILESLLSAAPAAPQPAPVDQNEARDAARWRYLAWHIGVAWNEQGFTSLVRIVSDKHRAMLGDMVDRMMAGDWPEAAPAPQPAQPDAEPLQVFVSPRAKTLMQAFEDGWRLCADSEYIGKEAQNDAFNQSRTVNHCIAEDMLFTQPAQPLTDEQCDAIYMALNDWAREFDQHEFGLPLSCGGGIEGGREIIRQAHGIGVKP